MRLSRLLLIAILMLSSTANASPATAKEDVLSAERSFAKSMAQRDLQAFASFLSEEAVFFEGTQALRGRKEVLASWAGLFVEEKAPFSWEPDHVEVLASGTLALSTGLVRNPEGKVVARFNSVWRLESRSTWRVIFDKGSPASQDEQKLHPRCDCPTTSFSSLRAKRH